MELLVISVVTTEPSFRPAQGPSGGLACPENVRELVKLRFDTLRPPEQSPAQLVMKG
jgi:hypothetical protein